MSSVRYATLEKDGIASGGSKSQHQPPIKGVHIVLTIIADTPTARGWCTRTKTTPTLAMGMEGSITVSARSVAGNRGGCMVELEERQLKRCWGD